ncbi:exported hypothetical protein [Rhodospirillaceae bacterium LM-1]|nr:exported hypothetical protein [Rhodospirillaceae bacterium LM-1]
MKRLSCLVLSLLFLSLGAQASEARLWIVKPAPAGDLSDCPKRAEEAVKAKSLEARLLASDAVIMFSNGGIPLLGEGGQEENFGELTDHCFALTVDGQTVISGATLWPHSARLLRFPVLQVLTRKQGEALRFQLTPAFPEKHSTMSPEMWGDKVGKLRRNALEQDYKAGALSRLARHIGTYRYDDVLNDPDVNATLNSLMNSKEKAVLKENMTVMSPIAFSGTHMILTGNKPHAGTTDTAMVAIHLVDGTIYAAAMHNGKVFQYRDKRTSEMTPDDILGFVEESERIAKAWSEMK